jgi:hypothetical protein
MVTNVGLIFFRLSSVKPLASSSPSGVASTKRGACCEKLRKISRSSGYFANPNNAALVGIGVYESQATFRIFDVARERRQQPVGIATRRFNLDDFGTQVGEQTGCIGRRNIAQFDDANVT